jgi:hypothetical protein
LRLLATRDRICKMADGRIMHGVSGRKSGSVFVCIKIPSMEGQVNGNATLGHYQKEIDFSCECLS